MKSLKRQLFSVFPFTGVEQRIQIKSARVFHKHTELAVKVILASEALQREKQKIQ